MKALARFEAFIENLIEGPFAHLQGGRIQPVQIAKIIERDMEANQAIGPGKTYVPNHFLVLLSPDDHGNLSPVAPALSRELAAYAVELATEHGWSTLGPIEVLISADEQVHRGTVRVVSSTTNEGAAAERLPQPAVDRTSAIDSRALAAALAMEPARAELVALAGQAVAPFALHEGTVTVGRSLDNDLVLDDPSVSRHHAEIRRQNGGYTLVDLESTNGSRVNGRSVATASLSDGDRVVFGGVELLFRLLPREGQRNG